MKSVLGVPGKLVALSVLIGSLLFANNVTAEEDWDFDLGIYGWLPTLETESESGGKSEISRDDIIKNLDMAAMFAARISKDKWSLSSDVLYFNLQNSDNTTLNPLLEFKKAELESWVVTPAIGYQVYQSDKDYAEIFAGGRYIWIKAGFDYKLTLPPPLPSGSRSASDSGSNWDAIVGVRGKHGVTDKWFIPYAISGGTGQSDSTFSAFGGLGYKFDKLDAVLGWRYMTWDFGSDTAIKNLTVNGPIVGALFKW